ncbi:MAG: DMT family transporter [Bacteriovoracia bacterium]
MMKFNLKFLHLLAFCTSGLLWGTSFLWIKIAVQDISAPCLATLRITAAFFGLFLMWAFTRKKRKLTLNPKTILRLCFVALINPVVPFMLISWAQKTIHSSVAAILNATGPLFTICLAHIFLNDEKFSTEKLAGLAVGFMGTSILVSNGIPSIGAFQSGSDVPSQLIVLVATFLYGYGSVLTRKFFRNWDPITQTMCMMGVAALLSWIVTIFILKDPVVLPSQARTWVAIFWLGLLNTALAFGLFFWVLQAWGATKSSLVNYVYPVIGAAAGHFILGEELNFSFFAGTVLIISGITIVNLTDLRKLLASA